MLLRGARTRAAAAGLAFVLAGCGVGAAPGLASMVGAWHVTYQGVQLQLTVDTDGSFHESRTSGAQTTYLSGYVRDQGQGIVNFAAQNWTPRTQDGSVPQSLTSAAMGPAKVGGGPEPVGTYQLQPGGTATFTLKDVSTGAVVSFSGGLS
jgi:hypothetical protein